MKYKCQICGYVYDDAKEKVPFSELPDTWKCPLCGASKSDFALVEEEKSSEIKPKRAVNTKFTEISFGQLSGLCSNLAKGCEKQYKDEEAELFRKLASYFSSITPEVHDATVEKLANDLQKDIDNYPYVRSVADENKDRGAARICVWGEKVTRMLSSLVNRYLKEGEAMMANTNVWVCTTCGFVFIGDKAPEICPVCKVPAWKFEKIEGRA